MQGVRHQSNDAARILPARVPILGALVGLVAMAHALEK